MEQILNGADWDRGTNRTLIAVLYASGVRAALVFHADIVGMTIVLPAPRPGHWWRRELDSVTTTVGLAVEPRSVTVFREAYRLLRLRGGNYRPFANQRG